MTMVTGSQVTVSLSLFLFFLLPLPAMAGPPDRGLPRGCPLPVLRISSGFGWRRDPILGQPEMHSGIDLAAPLGTPVRSTAAGHVAFVGRRGGYGRVVVVAHGTAHGGRVTSLYAHLQRVAVVPGEALAAGQILGRVGHSGRATGPHLHYEVRIAGVPIDPRPGLAPREAQVFPAAGWRAGS